MVSVRLRILLPLLVLPLVGCPDEVGRGVGRRGGLEAPTDLQGSPQNGASEVLLTWTDTSTGETGFRVEASDLGPFTSLADVTFWIVIPENQTSYVFGPASASTTYYFRVYAVTDNTQSASSSVITVVTPDVPPAPTGFQTVAISSTEIDISWLDAPNEASYRLERSSDGGGTWSWTTALAQDTVAYQSTALLPGTQYCYRLIAIGPDGDSPPSAVACDTTWDGPVTMDRIATPAWDGEFTSIAVNAAGTVEHISHYDVTNTQVLYTGGLVGGTFTTQIADSGPAFNSEVGSDGTSIVVNSVGTVHIAAYHRANGSTDVQALRYAVSDSGSFSASTVDSPGVGSRPILKLRPNGNLDVVYRDVANGLLKRGLYDGAVWSFESVTPSESIERFSFTLDASGDPHVAYQRIVNVGGVFRPELVYATKIGTWAYQVIVPTTERPDYNSIAVDPVGFVHVLYRSQTSGGLYHTTNLNGTWVTEVVDQEAFVSRGEFNSVAIDSITNVGRIHAAYYDRTTGDLRYARKDPGGVWLKRILDTSGDVGRHTSISVDANGGIHIAYQDWTNLDLKRVSGAP